MQMKNLQLKNESKEVNALVDAFNSDMPSESFYSKIAEIALEDSKAYDKLIKNIVEQEL